jgi:hydroxylamine reductase
MGKGCTKMGVCGKNPDVSALQDLLIHTVKGLSQVAAEGRKSGIVDHDVNVYTIRA